MRKQHFTLIQQWSVFHHCLSLNNILCSLFNLGIIHERRPQRWEEGFKKKRTHADMRGGGRGSSKSGRSLIFNVDKGYACVCEEGHYWSDKNRTRIKCPENTYKNTEVSDPPTCRHCPVGDASYAQQTLSTAKTQVSARNVHQV